MLREMFTFLAIQGLRRTCPNSARNGKDSGEKNFSQIKWDRDKDEE